MKNFVIGLIVIIVVIAIVVIIKRIGGDNDPTLNPDSLSDITAGASGGDLLPQ